VLKQSFGGLDTMICYAMKANSNQAVIKTLANLGAGMDVVSEGELRRARAAGVPAARSCSPASARPQPKWPCPARGHRLLQRRERTGA
jgi:diaminopimelate decarboxylase